MPAELLINEYAAKVQELFDELEQKQTALNQVVQLSCLPGCGKCCNNPEIEISPLEAYPWVMQTINQGQTEKYLELLSEAADSICIFYQHDKNNPDSGYCGNYKLRPLLCRLFGCSVLPDKFDNPRPVLCKLVKQADPDLEAKVKSAAERGAEVPIFNTYYTQLSTIDPFTGNLRKPINHAFLESLEKLSYLYEMVLTGDE